MNEILITGYTDPDLDCVACALAYEEFLNSQGIEAKAVVFGKPHREAQFVLDKLGLEVATGEDLINEGCEVILVDASDVRVSKLIRPEQVIEVIDHRKAHEAEIFVNAKIQIELVGSAATLIAEKFFEKKVEISRPMAALLYAAIGSNTINFKNRVTTERDRKMAAWLIEKGADKRMVKAMFKAKSELRGSLREIFLQDKGTWEAGGKRIAIFQLEILKVDEFVKEKLNEVEEFLQDFRKEDRLDVIFLTCVDLESGFNVFMVVDEFTKGLLEKVLGVKFERGMTKREGIIMRKEIVPLIKEELERL